MNYFDKYWLQNRDNIEIPDVHLAYVYGNLYSLKID